MPTIKNIAGYKFVPLSDLRVARARLLQLCKNWELKGTILLSTEGINLFVAGVPEKIDLLLEKIRTLPGLETFEVKESESNHQPFNRMLVRIKKEIIAFGVEGIDPSKRSSPKLSAKTLKQWLDEGRPVTLLDTRNDYEVKLGTFKNALPIGIRHFREFPDATRKLPEKMKEEPVVMFCTGGIRCEKAGPFMEREGFKNIFQLDGGILKYFEEVGGAHYDGECFVFDQRVGVDPSLHETESDQCFMCQTPLTKEEQEDSRYVPHRSCPYCFKTPEQQMALTIARRHEELRRITSPLPGSKPYDNYRPITVPDDCEGMQLIDVVGKVVIHLPREHWDEVFEKNLYVDSERRLVGANHIVHAGERYYRRFPDVVEPDVNPDVKIVYEDEALIVLNKPAPLPMHAGGRFNFNSLQYFLNQIYYPQKPKPAHRLDANTTGILLFTRTRHFASKLQPQFQRREIEKIYLVKVQGSPTQERFACDAPISAEARRVGTRDVDFEDGQASHTNFRVLKRNADGTTLLEARPVTGRTNQIRVHLWHLGFPVCGDAVYLAENKLGDTQTLGLEDPPLCLHAWKISFVHPLTNEPAEFCAPAPAWAEV